MYETTFTASAVPVAPGVVAFISMRGPYDQMAEGFESLYGWIGLHNLTVAGPPMAVFLTDPETVPPTEAVWEIEAPINDGVDADPTSDSVGIKHTPQVTVASTTYVGPYEEMHQTYVDLVTWIAENGYKVAGPLQEIYFTDPDEAEPSAYVTEVRVPIKPA